MSQTRRNILSGVMFAMQPELLDTAADIVEAHLRGERAAPRQQGDQPPANAGPVADTTTPVPGKGFAVTPGGVAVIPLAGIMARNPGFIEQACMGVTNSLAVARLVEQAADDPEVCAIVLDVDSPGGTVNGTLELAQAVIRADRAKPVVAYTGGDMCSAAYWVASAARKVVAVATATVGSIGVATVHYDRSASDAAKGVARSMISAGSYKRIASDEKPLTEEGRAYLQAQVDRLYATFVEAVAEHRKVDVATVLSNMADGRVFIGRQALAAGLVDALGDMEAALTLAGQLAQTTTPQQEATMKGADSTPGTQPTGVTDMAALTPEQFKATRPDIADALLAEGRAEGAKAERERVLEIIDARGPADLTRNAVAEGTPAAHIYRAVLDAERAGRINAHDELAKSLEQSAGAQGAPRQGPLAGPATGADFMQLARQHATENKVPLSAAIKAVAARHPELHAASISGTR